MKRKYCILIYLCVICFTCMGIMVFFEWENIDGYNNVKTRKSSFYCDGISETNDYLNDVPPHPNDYKNFANQYFRNLTYHGLNEKGTCGYIAIGMFLSYYDTFWDDNIIPENYDRVATIDGEYSYDRSPGIFDERSTNQSDYNNDFTYKSYMKSQTNSLHSYLISIGETLGYVGNSMNYSFGLEFEEVYNVLMKYGETNTAVNKDNFTYMYGYNANGDEKGNDQIRQKIIYYAKMGWPVIVGLQGYVTEKGSGSLARHVIVVYDYDEETDSLYGHFGWGAGYTHTNIYGAASSYTFTDTVGYIVGRFKNSHSHSNNYVVSSDETLCSCQLVTHEHMIEYKNANASSHTAYCYCGYSQVESHIFLPDGIGRFDICTKCKYRKKSDGGFVPIPGVSIVDEVEMMQNEMDQTQYIVAA